MATSQPKNTTTPLTPIGSGSAPPTPVVIPKGLQASLSAMAQGWSTVIPAGFVLPSNDGGYAQSTILPQLQGWLANYTAAATAKAASEAAVTTVKGQEAAIRAEIQRLKVALQAYFGKSSPQLIQFGIKVAKPPAKLDGKSMVAKAARARNTRTIRGTLGKLQRENKGQSGPVTVTVAPAQSTGSAPSSTATPGPLIIVPSSVKSQ